MSVGHPAEKLDQIDVVKGLRRPTDGIDRTAYAGSQNGWMPAMCKRHGPFRVIAEFLSERTLL